MVGRHLSEYLINNGYDIVWLSRKAGITELAGKQIPVAAWDPAKGTIDTWAIERADYIIHLAGAGVADKRWSEKRKQEIASSRIESGALLVKTLSQAQHKVKALISASAIGWYGPDTAETATNAGFIESDPPYPGFLGDTCKAWESSVAGVEALGIRLVKCRIGIVLSPKGGALKEFMKPLKMGVAAIMGNGEQIVSWIHIEDLCRLFLYAIQETTLSGVYNAVAPAPVTNRELVITLAKNMRSWYIPFPVPSFLLKIVLGEMSIEVLKSAKVSSAKIQSAGFIFHYPNINSALQAV